MEMSMEEIQENFKKLKLEGSRVMEANKEVEATFVAECKAATAEELSDLQRAKIEKTEKETLEAYQFMLTHLEKLVHKAQDVHQNWNHWAPPAEQKDFRVD